MRNLSCLVSGLIILCCCSVTTALLNSKLRKQLSTMSSASASALSSSSSSVTPATTTTADAKAAIDFLTLARGLKTTPRTGWIRQEAGPKIESVADHSWRISLMALLVAGGNNNSSTRSSNPDETISGIDTIRCLKMALVHDLAEAQVGDITPHCGVSDQDKHTREEQAMIRMTKTLEGSSMGLAGCEIVDLWQEYEEGISMEAKLVKDMDKLEMILQALEYEQDGDNKQSLDGFFDSTRDKWRTEIGKAWGEEIESRRRQKQTE